MPRDDVIHPGSRFHEEVAARRKTWRTPTEVKEPNEVKKATGVKEAEDD